MRTLLAAAFAFTLVGSSAALAAPGVATTSPADLPAGTYVLDPTHASLSAKLSHMGFSNFTLRMPTVAASFTYDPKAPAAAKITATVDASKMDSGVPVLDKEITGDGWFDSAKYPTATFVSTSVTPTTANHGTVTGDLTFHGVTKPVTLDVTFNGYGAGLVPLSHRVGFSATGVIKRSDFGVTKYVPLVGDDVSLVIEAEFTPK
jgi:polyisoprenoid-binding protein YceI